MKRLEFVKDAFSLSPEHHKTTYALAQVVHEHFPRSWLSLCQKWLGFKTSNHSLLLVEPFLLERC